MWLMQVQVQVLQAAMIDAGYDDEMSGDSGY